MSLPEKISQLPSANPNYPNLVFRSQVAEMVDEWLDGLLEELAALEHEQWCHWQKYLALNDTKENKEKWLFQAHTPYLSLSEEEKESDRVWARKVLALIGR